MSQDTNGKNKYDLEERTAKFGEDIIRLMGKIKKRLSYKSAYYAVDQMRDQYRSKLL